LKQENMKRSVTIILLLALPLIIAATLWLGEAPIEQSPPPSDTTSTLARGNRTEPLEWGVYQIYWGRQYDRVLAKELKNFATIPQYVMFYRDLGRPFPKHGIDTIHDIGATPMISLELWMWGDRSGDSYLPAINTGDYDAFFRKWAAAAKKDGRRVLLRFGFEMNGEWFS